MGFFFLTMEQLRYKRHDNPPVNLITIYDCGCSGYSSLEIVVKTAARWRFWALMKELLYLFFLFFFHRDCSSYVRLSAN